MSSIVMDADRLSRSLVRMREKLPLSNPAFEQVLSGGKQFEANVVPFPAEEYKRLSGLDVVKGAWVSKVVLRRREKSDDFLVHFNLEGLTNAASVEKLPLTRRVQPTLSVAPEELPTLAWAAHPAIIEALASEIHDTADNLDGVVKKLETMTKPRRRLAVRLTGE